LPGKLPNWTCGYGRRRAGDRRLRRAADLVSIQLLDGIGAGIFGALFFIVIADLTRGTGHYNLALGAASAAWGIRAKLGEALREQYDLMEPAPQGLAKLVRQLDAREHERDIAQAGLSRIDETKARKALPICTRGITLL
jgi:hypothetical protein